MRDGGLSIQFRIEGDDCPLAAVTRETGSTVEAEPGLLRSDGNVLLQFRAVTDAERIARRLEDERRLQYVHAAEHAEGTEFRCLSLDPCVQHQFFDIGFMPLSIRYRAGHEFYTGAVVGHESLKQVIERARESVSVRLEGVQRMKTSKRRRLTQRWDVNPRTARSHRSRPRTRVLRGPAGDVSRRRGRRTGNQPVGLLTAGPPGRSPNLRTDLRRELS